jgi:SagB-type dehydrogenase family enzyme
MEVTSPTLVDQVIQYHIHTKHHFHRYARSAGYLDWANQPDPFRRYAGSALVSLPLLAADEPPGSPSYPDIYRSEAVEPQQITVKSLSRFFELALALSAWKRAGESEWALRSNPSSGNLHPTEGYLLIPPLEALDLKPGLYHYAPKEHGLELRAEFQTDRLVELLHPFPPDAFLFGLTSVHWREAWKYGERAFRYCHHDVGHAIGSARIAAATLGWHAVLLDGCDQDTIATLMGTQRVEDYVQAEAEHPDCLMAVWPSGDDARFNGLTMPLFLNPADVQALRDTTWFGQANRLSTDHGFDWNIIDNVAQATWKMHVDKTAIPLGPVSITPPSAQEVLRDHLSAGQVIRQRRSAVAFDAKTSISAATFFTMLERVMPHHEL